MSNKIPPPRNKARPISRTRLPRCYDVLVFCFLLMFSVLGETNPAHAICFTPCVILMGGTVFNEDQVTLLENGDSQNNFDGIIQLHKDTRTKVNDHTDADFEDHKKWLMDVIWKQKIIPNLVMVAEQVSAVGLEQMEVIGVFLDAKHQLESQRLFQQMAARAYKDYTPSEGFCTVATMTRSLAASDRNTDVNTLVLSQRSLRRQLLSTNGIGTEGSVTDRASRYAQFQLRYCDKDDNTAGLAAVCKHDNAVPTDRLNRDIDFFRTVSRPMNLDLNLSNGAVTEDEKDVFALEANLYSHELQDPVEPGKMKDDSALQAYLDTRSIIAKRSVAESSFQAIAAMKSTGQTSVALTGQYLKAALLEMGISDADATKMLGDNPSYYTQMEILTKRMFQRPEFFVDLYDKPVNVERKSVALQAISLMQRRDIFKSALRTEAMLSLLLELDVMKEQEAVENQVKRLKK